MASAAPPQVSIRAIPSARKPQASSSSSSPPTSAIAVGVLPTRMLNLTIGGVSTTIITQSFTDRILIHITQLNKFGVLYQANTSVDPSTFSSSNFETSMDSMGSDTQPHLPPPLPSTTVTKLMGTEPTPNHATLYALYISQIASIVQHAAPQESRPLIVSLALKPSAKHNTNTTQLDSKYNDENHEDQQDDSPLLDDAERDRFLQIMNAVQKCRVW